MLEVIQEITSTAKKIDKPFIIDHEKFILWNVTYLHGYRTFEDGLYEFMLCVIASYGRGI